MPCDFDLVHRALHTLGVLMGTGGRGVRAGVRWHDAMLSIMKCRTNPVREEDIRLNLNPRRTADC